MAKPMTLENKLNFSWIGILIYLVALIIYGKYCSVKKYNDSLSSIVTDPMTLISGPQIIPGNIKQTIFAIMAPKVPK